MNNQIDNHFSDQHMVSKVLGGDRHAFAAIIHNTENLVAQIVFKMIVNPEDRKDLVQEIYLKVYKNLSGFKFQSKLSTWIAQIAYNTCFNFLEKKRPLLAEDLLLTFDRAEEAQEYYFAEPVYHSLHVAENILRQKELTKILALHMEKLPPVYKTLITLFHHEELSYEEIATITELPSGTVKSYLFRARKYLKDNLLDQYKKEDL